MRFVRLAVLFVVVSPTLASAHLDMLDPPRRYGDRDLKQGPCGIAFGEAGDVLATYEAGATIDIRIDEYVDHPSHYRVAIDLDGGDDDLADPVCLSGCDDNRQEEPTFEDPEGVLVLGNFEDEEAELQTLRVTLPDVACERCTLQVMQIMYDKRPYTLGGNDNYYRCSDIALTASTGGDAGPGMDAGTIDAGTQDAGAASDAGVDAPAVDAAAGDAGPESSEGGCSASPGAGPGGIAGVVFLSLFGVALRRRRS